MEERGDLQGNAGRQSSLRPGANLKSALSGRSTPRGSPSFRKLNSGRTSRRDGRGSGQWIRSNSVLLWLILITLWAYLGFYVQSKWAHGNNNQKPMGFGSKSSSNISDEDQNQQNVVVLNNGLTDQNKNMSNLANVDVGLEKTGIHRRSMSVKKPKKSNTKRRQRGKAHTKVKTVALAQNDSLEEQEEDIPKSNTTYGLIVGPFSSTEERILEWTPEKRSGTCDRKGDFARLVWSRRYVLIFHELSMTGAPLSMLELATELMSCGATVSVVILNKRGGLMPEITRRRIKVIEDKEKLSFKAAMKADLVIAGSAVCASWIEQYHEQFPAGSSQIAWWIMENRLEYFNRSKLMLNRVKMLIFLSESQSKQWLAWCQGEGIKLYTPPAVIPLSVNDNLAFVAGIPCSLNTPSYSVEKMIEKRLLLRNAVREEMGLTENDMLVMSLSSINPGKGQQLLLESASLILEGNLTLADAKNKKKEINNTDIAMGKEHASTKGKRKWRTLFQNKKRTKKKISMLPNLIHSNGSTPVGGNSNARKLMSDSDATREYKLKVLVGSVGSKSNKVVYVKGLLQYLSQHSELSKSVIWTPATTHVASLYSAADVYVINSQGVGETFGRVTIEAMAYGLPVVGTDAGGTQEIVEHNVTGLLHPVGHPGNEPLARNLLYFLKHPSERKQMGTSGRNKVEKMYLKSRMYQKFALVLSKCMKPK
ncbi:hypothetical protein ACHQM5_002340 [Ranunculus cassubicifolius]